MSNKNNQKKNNQKKNNQKKNNQKKDNNIEIITIYINLPGEVRKSYFFQNTTVIFAENFIRREHVLIGGALKVNYQGQLVAANFTNLSNAPKNAGLYFDGGISLQHQQIQQQQQQLNQVAPLSQQQTLQQQQQQLSTVQNANEFGPSSQGVDDLNLRSGSSKSIPTYGINDITQVQTSFTLEDFISYLSNSKCGDIMNNHISGSESDDILKNSSKFEEKRISLIDQEFLEKDLQEIFSGMQRYGNNVLEDTHRGSNDSFKALNFACVGESPKHPDCTLRISTNHEEGDLLDWRLCPWAIIAYLELKSSKVNVETAINQALYYAKCTLLCCPNRNYFITAVYNLNHIVFCGVKFSEEKCAYYCSRVISDSLASREIAKFLSCPSSLLGFENFYPFDTYQLVKALGKGSTSTCVSIRYNNQSLALKISRDEVALVNEKMFLNYLNHSNSELKIPTLHICDERYMTLLSPVYDRPKKLNQDNFLQAWKALHEVHRYGICHRDIRIPNLGMIKKKGQISFHWMDWSSARPFRNIDDLSTIEKYIVGCTSTASRPVLKRMTYGVEDYICYPSDEGLSMINLVILEVNPTLKGAILPFRAKYVLEFWDISYHLLNTEVQNIIQQLENLSENYSDDQLPQINEYVQEAINILCEKNSENFTALDENQGDLKISADESTIE